MSFVVFFLPAMLLLLMLQQYKYKHNRFRWLWVCAYGWAWAQVHVWWIYLCVTPGLTQIQTMKFRKVCVCDANFHKSLIIRMVVRMGRQRAECAHERTTYWYQDERKHTCNATLDFGKRGFGVAILTWTLPMKSNAKSKTNSGEIVKTSMWP